MSRTAGALLLLAALTGQDALLDPKAPAVNQAAPAQFKTARIAE